MSKQQLFWTVARNFYDVLETCCVLCVLLASHPVSQNTTLTTKLVTPIISDRFKKHVNYFIVQWNHSQIFLVKFFRVQK